MLRMGGKLCLILMYWMWRRNYVLYLVKSSENSACGGTRKVFSAGGDQLAPKLSSPLATRG